MMTFFKNIINYGYYSYYGVSNSFNILRLLFGVTTFIGYSKITGKYSDRLLNNLFHLININGYIVIKFTQWLTARMLLMETDKNKIEVLKKLENIYENCHTHTEGETNTIYYNDFNININDKYKLLKVIGSGSIGQVYKALDKETNKHVAIKIKHFNIEKKYLISYGLIKFIVYLFKKIPYINYHYMPMNLGEFITQINLQMNFKNEYKNAIKIKENFKDNPIVIIPDVYEYSNNVIIMEYIDGTSYNELKIPKPKRYRIALYFTILIYEMSVKHGFLHGDLHNGNWKVQIRESDNHLNNDFNIVFYDFGYVMKINKIEDSLVLVEKLRYSEHKEIGNLLVNNSYCIQNHNDNNNRIDQNYIDSIILDCMLPENILNPNIILQIALKISRRYKRIFKTELINILLIFIQIEKLCVENNFSQQVPMTYDSAREFQYNMNNECLALLNMYKYHPKLIEYYNNLNKKYSVKKDVFSSLDYLENLKLE